MLRVLESLEARWDQEVESKHDIFSGDMMFWRFYMCWLSSIGLLETQRDAFGNVEAIGAPLSDEGRSVLLMLRATREPHRMAMPFRDVLSAMQSAKRTQADEARESALRVFERQVKGMPSVFAREQVGRSPVVTLTGCGLGGRLPTARVV